MNVALAKGGIALVVQGLGPKPSLGRVGRPAKGGLGLVEAAQAVIGRADVEENGRGVRVPGPGGQEMVQGPVRLAMVPGGQALVHGRGRGRGGPGRPGSEHKDQGRQRGCPAGRGQQQVQQQKGQAGPQAQAGAVPGPGYCRLAGVGRGQPGQFGRDVPGRVRGVRGQAKGRALGLPGQFGQGRHIHPGPHRVSGRIAQDSAGPVRDGRAGRAAHGHGENRRPQIVCPVGQGRRFLAVGKKQHRAPLGRALGQGQPGGLQGGGQVGAAQGLVGRGGGVQKEGKGGPVKGDGADQTGPTGKGHQAGAQVRPPGQHVQDQGLGRGQTVRVDVPGQHAFGAVQGHDQARFLLGHAFGGRAQARAGGGQGQQGQAGQETGGLDPPTPERGGEMGIGGQKAVPATGPGRQKERGQGHGRQAPKVFRPGQGHGSLT